MILERKLRFTLKTITDLARNINLVAINAGISASHMEKFGEEGRAFKVIAREIHDISNKSLSGINGLGDILAEVQFLSKVINIAGSLRMLSQKIMKLHLISAYNIESNEAEVAKDYAQSIQKFHSVLATVKGCRLNTTEIDTAIIEVEEQWGIFQESLNKNNIADGINKNNDLLASLQNLVAKYEKLSG